jgi:hypothetical protein
MGYQCSIFIYEISRMQVFLLSFSGGESISLVGWRTVVYINRAFLRNPTFLCKK